MRRGVASLKRSVVAVCALVSAGLVGTALVGLSSAAHSSASPAGQTTLNVDNDPSETAVYSSLISPLPGNIPSLGVEAYYFDELGNEVNLARSGTLSSVVVTMSSFACQTGSWNTDTCMTTTPGATYPVDITFNIYSVGTGNTLGAPIATDTQTFNIPFRPTADNLTTPPGTNCQRYPFSEGEWYDPTENYCFNGLTTNITFNASDFTPADPTLPATVIYGIAYNTDTNGYHPLGPVNSPANSLNIGMSTEPQNVAVGSDATPGYLFMAQSAADTTSSEITCTTPLPAGVFQPYNVLTTVSGCGLGSFGNIPAVEINTASQEATTTTMTATSTTMTATSTTTPVIPPSPSNSTTTSSTTTTTTAAPKPFPHANVSYPNAAIVTFGSTHYVFAGGRAFNASRERADSRAEGGPRQGARRPRWRQRAYFGGARPGQLVFTRPVNGNNTIYVVGTDGQLHGFAAPKQFLGDGYDPALVITVPNLGGLTVGSNAGTTLTALATKADGAIINSSGTFYTFAGGKGFGIPTQAALLGIRKTNTAQELKGSVSSADTSTAIASGSCSAPPAPYTSATWATCTPSRRRRSWPMTATVALQPSRRLTPAASLSFSPIQALSLRASPIS